VVIVAVTVAVVVTVIAMVVLLDGPVTVNQMKRLTLEQHRSQRRVLVLGLQVSQDALLQIRDGFLLHRCSSRVLFHSASVMKNLLLHSSSDDRCVCIILHVINDAEDLE